MVNYVKVTNYRKTFQNKIFPELNSKKHTPSPTVWVLRNCGIAENSSCGIAQNLSFAKAERAILREMTFANDCANCCFSRKTDAQRKKNFAFRSAKIAQKFCEWKPYFCHLNGIIFCYLSSSATVYDLVFSTLIYNLFQDIAQLSMFINWF